MENSELIEVYKKEHIENLKGAIKESGKCETFIQLMGKIKDMDKPAIIHIAVDFKSSDEMSAFIDTGIPMICKEINKKEMELLCVTYNTEAYMRAFDVEEGAEVEKKKDVVVVTFSEKEKEKTFVYEIETNNYEVNEKGELEQQTNIVDCTVMGENINDGVYVAMLGSMVNLYEKFAKHLKT